MSITREDFDEIKRLAGIIEGAMNEIDYSLKHADNLLYERWKAYGKQVTDEFVSMGPCLPQVIDELEKQVEEETEED
jgi:hypothetical protein